MDQKDLDKFEEYTVTWTIQLQAKAGSEGFADAVCQAMGMLQDPENTATYFRVKREQGYDAGEEVFRDFQEDIEKCGEEE